MVPETLVDILDLATGPKMGNFSHSSYKYRGKVWNEQNENLLVNVGKHQIWHICSPGMGVGVVWGDGRGRKIFGHGAENIFVF